MYYHSHSSILPACTTATAHIFAHEFDLMMDFMAGCLKVASIVSTARRMKYKKKMKFFFLTFRLSYVTNFYSGSKFLLEMVISSQKIPRIMICMHSGEQKRQNGPENQMISKLCLENKKFFETVCKFMAIFSNKQAEVSTGVKTYDTTAYKVWKHVAWSKHAVKLWQYVEHPTGWISFAWHCFAHHLNKDTSKELSTAVAVETPTENQFTQCVNTQHYFMSLIGMFWGYTLVKPCLTAKFNNSGVLCIISNNIIRQCLDSEPHHWNWTNDYVCVHINGYDIYHRP